VREKPVAVALDKVSKVVGGETHISDVSLVLERGSVNVLLGQTLAGKTSLMRLLAGLDRPSAGRILVDEQDVSGVDVRRRSVAMVYQSFINYPTLSVYENIASPLRVAKRSRAEIDQKVREAARLLRLEAYLDRSPLALSGGQQQRTALARALVKGADLVLMDEPLANLDYKLREELREELPRIFLARGSILVYSTTEPAEALLLGGNVATLWQGRLTQFGRAVEVFHRPADLISAQVFSDPPLNLMRVEKRGRQLQLATGGVVAAQGAFDRLPDGAYLMGFRAHQLHLHRPSPGAIALPGRVQVSEITGSESFVHLDYDAVRWVAVAGGVHEIEPGAVIDTFVDLARVFVFTEAGALAAAPDFADAA
jgi:glycerol transport system ATP-binding protein